MPFSPCLYVLLYGQYVIQLVEKTIFQTFSGLPLSIHPMSKEVSSSLMLIFLSMMKNTAEVKDRTTALCFHVCSVLSSKCVLSSWVCRSSCEWFMCLHRGYVEGMTLPRASSLPIPFFVFFTSWQSHGLWGLWLGSHPWSQYLCLFASTAKGDVQTRAW